MSYKEILNLKVKKDEGTKVKEDLYKEHVVVGSDIFAVRKFFDLKNEYGEEKVFFLSSKNLTKEILSNLIDCLPNGARDSFLEEELKNSYPTLEIKSENKKSKFYKDASFYEFGGRAKPHELKEGESFFVEEALSYNLKNLLSQSEWESFESYINFNPKIEFELTTPKDLVNVENFKIYLGDNRTIGTSKIHLFMNPKKFLEKLKNKDDLTEEDFRLFDSLDSKKILSYFFTTDKEIKDHGRTIFIPQSQTHELGHYIVDLKEKKGCAYMIIPSEEELSEEDLSKKIRHLKQTLKRIFECEITSDKISFYDDYSFKKTPREITFNVNLSFYPNPF